jgi:hypothetical protein
MQLRIVVNLLQPEITSEQEIKESGGRIVRDANFKRGK